MTRQTEIANTATTSFWKGNSRMIRTILMSVLIAMTPAAAIAENLVVIAATGVDDTLQPGVIVKSSTRLDLSSGVSLTLLSQNGSVLKLDGPFAGSATVAGAKVETDKVNAWATTLSKISLVVSKRVARSNVVGSSRGAVAPDGDAHDNIWLLTVDSSGHRCLPKGGTDLWRKDANKKVELDLRSQSAQEKGMTWRAGQNLLRLPQKFVEDGTLVVMKIDTQPRRFTIHVLPNEIGADRWGAVLHWMIANQCTRQAGLLIDLLHSGEIVSQ